MREMYSLSNCSSCPDWLRPQRCVHVGWHEFSLLQLAKRSVVGSSNGRSVCHKISESTQRRYQRCFLWKLLMTMQAMPIPKDGTCPSGYSAQGNMCVPNANARPAIPKDGTCPSGWSAQGKYCVANTANPKNVIPKNGPCPSGYSAQGNYCVQK